MMRRVRAGQTATLLLGLFLATCLAACSTAPTATPLPQSPAPTPLAPVALQPTVTPVPQLTETPVTLRYWEQDSDAADVLLDVLAEEFTALNPSITIERSHFSNEELRDQFHAATLSGEAPALVRALNDYAGPFSELGIIQSVDALFDPAFLAQFFSGALDAAVVKGVLWGVPDNYGRHLMLLFNKELVDAVPGDTSAWIEQLRLLTDEPNGVYGLVYNLDEPYWLVPWLGGFGAWPLDPFDQPTLDSAGVISALQFVHDLKHVHRVVPPQADYNAADELFREGRAAYVIDGDWSLPAYRATGIDLGVAVLPKVSETGLYPSPMTSGTFWMFSAEASPDELEAARRFVSFMTSAGTQLRWLEKFQRLPSSREVAASALVVDDPIVASSVEQLSRGRGLPVAPEMLCAWSAMRPALESVMADQLTPADAANAMQADAARCVRELAPDAAPEDGE